MSRRFRQISSAGRPNHARRAGFASRLRKPYRSADRSPSRLVSGDDEAPSFGDLLVMPQTGKFPISTYRSMTDNSGGVRA
jgi:hypothetical protein